MTFSKTGVFQRAVRLARTEADAIDDAEAKRRGVPVEVVQLENANKRIAYLDNQLKQTTADLAKAQADKVAVDKKAGDVADGQYLALGGVWQEGPEENHIQLTIVQKGDEFTADCTYQHPKDGEIRWQMKGTVSKDGEIRGRLVHTKAPPTWVNQTRVGVLSADGKTITLRANLDGGGVQDIVWRQLAKSKAAMTPEQKANVAKADAAAQAKLDQQAEIAKAIKEHKLVNGMTVDQANESLALKIKFRKMTDSSNGEVWQAWPSTQAPIGTRAGMFTGGETTGTEYTLQVKDGVVTDWSSKPFAEPLNVTR